MNIKEAHNYLGQLLSQGIDPNTALIIQHSNEWCNHTEISEIRVGYYEYTEQVNAQLPTRRPYKGLGLMLVSSDQQYSSINYTLGDDGFIMCYHSDRTDIPVRGPGINDEPWVAGSLGKPTSDNPSFVSFILEVDGLTKLPVIITATDKVKDDINTNVNRLVIGDTLPTMVRTSKVIEVVDFIMSDWVTDKPITYKMGICTVTAMKSDEAPVIEFVDGKPTFKV